MRLALVKKGFEKEAAEKQIQHWIENGQIIPTWTNDDHFIILSEKDNAIMKK